MAAKHFYRQGFLLLLFNFISTAASDRRFSDLKRCADKECSMLVCRGKALTDFSGPDCRFLSFKKSETIYVYYKLAGWRADIWAGSIGNTFGYFPKDLLAVNHLYIDKELEVPTEETDFVCFDTGFDKFNDYDIDSLLGPTLKQISSENEQTSKQIQVAEDTPKETQPSEEEEGEEEEGEEEEEIDSEKETLSQDTEQDSDKIPDDEVVSVPEHENVNEEPPLEEVVEPEQTATTPEMTEELIIPEELVDVDVVSETSEPKETPSIPQVESVSKDEIVSEQEPVSNSEGAQIPDLKTTFGTTFDAVVTEDEITTKVMPFEEEESHDVDNQSKESVDVVEDKTPLLSFSKEPAYTPAPDSPKERETPPVTLEEEPKAKEEKNMWTSIGDAVFSVVTGGELTGIDETSEEDEDDEREEEEKPIAAQTPQDAEEVEVEKDVEEPLTTEAPTEPEPVVEEVLQEPSALDNQEPVSESGELLTETEVEDDREVVGHEEEREETTEDTPQMQHRESKTVVSQKESEIINEHKEQEFEAFKDSEVSDVNTDVLDSGIVTEEIQGLDNEPEENTTEASQVLIDTESETHQNLSHEEQPANVQEDVKPVEERKGDRIDRFFLADIRKNIRQLDLLVAEPATQDEPPTEEREEDDHAEPEGGEVGEKEELLEDENAVLNEQPENVVEPEAKAAAPAPEPTYSDSVMRLTLLREHFTQEDMARVQRLLGLKNLFKVEAMFSDLDVELQSTRQSHLGSSPDIESALEGILEASENTILDEIEKMLDELKPKQDLEQRDDTTMDEETEILDDFQELAFSLRQKYSTASDSTPLAAEETQKGESELNVTKDVPYSVEEDKVDFASEVRSEDNITVTNQEEKPPQAEEEPLVGLDEVHATPDVSVEEDSGHFNRNKENLPGFSAADDLQTFPHATLEKPLDMGLGVEVEPSSSGSFESLDPVSEMHEVKEGLFSTGLVYMGYICSVMMNKSVEWTTVVISLLPDEWKPGETLYGCPWQAVIATALVGIMTFTVFFWRTVLSVKSREYLVDAKKLTEQIQALHKERSDALAKMSELQKQTEKLKESQKQSKENVSSSMKKIQRLENKVSAAESHNQKMIEEKNSYFKLLEEERTHSLKYETRIEKLEKANEKLQLNRKKIQEELSKTAVLLDEAKIREDARKVLHKSREKEYAALKEENKTLKIGIKGWEDKHKELSDQIKTYQKSQKELEDSVMLKDHNVEVLSELLADLDACDQQKGETKFLANGEIAPDKKTFVKNRIKQMMDVTRVQTTLTVVEEERDRFMTKLLNEEKTRKALEEQHEEMNHAVTTLKRDKSHVENQLKILQQKNEIMVEMYQQKENALQQRLTKEELDRRSKESMLTEVGGKAVEAEEQVKVLRQRINEMEDQMKKTEEVYKEQIKEQENKTHSNWLNARNAERALNQEKLEASKLREKLAVLTSQLNERRAPLFRPNSGQPAGPRQADSYGPSPVSGGAPSPPIMIEGPRRPPSAPVGRRIDPYGPRPPSDPHGRYAENKHMSGLDMMGPRSSSPANMDGPTQAVDPQVKDEAQAEASTESPEPGPGSFIASPIRDSPGPMGPGPPMGPGHHDPHLPPGPHGRLPPLGPYRPPRPGHYHLPPGPPPPNLPPPLHGPPLPPNGHPGMPMPGPMGGEFGPRPANGHAFHPRPGPDPRGPPPPHFRPPLPHHYGPMLPPHGVRGPMGPRPPVPHDMRFPGPHMDLPPGVPPQHHSHPGDALHNSAGPHSGPGPELHARQEAPQDSARPAMVKP